MAVDSFIALAYLDLGQVDALLNDVEERGKRLAPAFRALKKPMRADMKDHAEKAQSSDGAWPKRASISEQFRQRRNAAVSTARRQARLLNAAGLKKFKAQRKTPVKLLGRLPTAIRLSNTDLSTKATSWAKFGAAHNRGALVGHHRSVKLPRREFLWMSDTFIQHCTVIISHFVMTGKAVVL